MNASILIIEDEYALAAALSTLVRRLDATPVVAASGQGGIDKLGSQNFALIILDVGLPVYEWAEGVGEDSNTA